MNRNHIKPETSHHVDVKEKHEQIPNDLNRGLALFSPTHLAQHLVESGEGIDLQDLEDLQLLEIVDELQLTNAEDVSNEVQTDHVVQSDFLGIIDLFSVLINEGSPEIYDNVDEKDKGKGIEEEVIARSGLVRTIPTDV